MKLSLTGSMLLALAVAPGLHAQFTSGSTGTDGALNYTTRGEPDTSTRKCFGTQSSRR